MGEQGTDRDRVDVALREFWARADDTAPEGLALDLDRVLASLPADDPVALFERASLSDYLGREAEAIPVYRAALAAGLTEPRRGECLIQLASSLRNIGDPSGAIALLHGYPADHPLAEAARAFEALALFDDQKPAPALRTALRALAPHLPQYGRSVERYARGLVASPRIRAIAVAVIVKDGHVLAEEYAAGTDRPAFLRAPGGGIAFGEEASSAMRRELREELAADVDDLQLLTVAENIFDDGRKRGHEIAYVFAVRSASLQAVPLDERLRVLDGDNTVGWYRIDDLRSGATPFYPAAALDLAAALSHEDVC
ncbi:tetratricopeptide repeat protein [Microbacterium sp. NM3R9]|uniref:tetratricopeptide repeat protein n=1 Tax=Microbacterium thalli TaxID=3027921 RepID=UPI0023657C79|nr:tetratricopeptide repeat protein [Microbacterium thalli]MDN8548661.1 tetratricopeptide repeat protein [Microbacterium thalli]